MPEEFAQILQAMKFCPYCGGKLSDDKSVYKFCPHCGKPLLTKPSDNSLAATGMKTQFIGEARRLSNSGLDDILRYYEHLVAEKISMGMSAEQARLEVATVLKKAGGKIASEDKKKSDLAENLSLKEKSINICSAEKSASDGFKPPTNQPVGCQFYSIILKGCVDKERLADKLARVLLRGYVPVRMAVENIPCIAIYKSKLDGMLSIIDILIEERSAFAVIGGDLPMAKDWRRLLGERNGNLRIEELALLDKLPINYLLGESFSIGISNAKFDQQLGIVLLGEQSLFFVYNDNDKAVCVVLPYYRMEDTLWQEGDNSVKISYSDSRRDDLFILPSSKVAGALFASVCRAKGNWRQQIKFRLTCCQCLTVETVDFLQGLKQKQCSKCSTDVRKDILAEGIRPEFTWL